MTDTAIRSVLGRRIWDSRGRPTVEVEVTLAGGAQGRGIAPAGASKGRGEALELRDGGECFGGFGVERALANVNGAIAEALRGQDAAQQQAIDQRLIALDGTAQKALLGGNAIVATSLAVLDAAAAAAGVPLWRHLARAREAVLPLPQVQIFGGGAHAARRVDVQDFLAVPVGAKSFDQALAMIAEVYAAAGHLMAERGTLAGVSDEGGWWPAFDSNEQGIETLLAAIERARFAPGQEVAIALDIAASEFGRDGSYRLGLDGRELDRDGLAELFGRWIERYPIVSIEDPFAEDDHEGMRRFTAAFGRRIQIVGDDYLVTNAQRIEAAATAGACNAVLLKPNQAGTISETEAALIAARRAGFATIISARSGETEDTAIVHLAAGWAAGQLKVGAFARSERMAKWNDGLRIEQAMGARARFAGASALARWGRAPDKVGR